MMLASVNTDVWCATNSPPVQQVFGLFLPAVIALVGLVGADRPLTKDMALDNRVRWSRFLGRARRAALAAFGCWAGALVAYAFNYARARGAACAALDRAISHSGAMQPIWWLIVIQWVAVIASVSIVVAVRVHRSRHQATVA